MRSYIAIFKCRISTLFQYRLAALAGLSTQIFWGIIKVMIFNAFYGFSAGPQPITLPQSITFIWLGQALLQMIPWNVDKELEAQVRTGNVAYDLIRPVDLYGFWYFRSMALRIVPTIMRSIPLFILAGFFFGLTAPVSIGAGIGFVISLIFSTFLSAAMTTAVLISLFWTISGEGILRLLPHTSLILSGMLVPLPLFPWWMQPFLSLQPFRCIIDIPIRIYTGVIPTSNLMPYIMLQVVWCLIFIFGGKWLMNRALKRVVIQGG